MNAILMFPVLLLLILAGFPIALAMISVAFVFGLIQFGSGIIQQNISMLDQISSNNILTAIPLFIFMGAMIESSGLAKRLFSAIYVWVWRLPGAIAITTILMGTVFAAASGVV